MAAYLQDHHTAYTVILQTGEGEREGTGGYAVLGVRTATWVRRQRRGREQGGGCTPVRDASSQRTQIT